MPNLEFVAINENNSHLLSPTVSDLVFSLSQDQRPLVAEIDPKYMGGKELSDYYGVKQEDGANCIIVEAKKGDSSEFVAIVVPVGYRADLNSIVRKHLEVRKVFFAPLDKVLELTRMEYGSITPFGLPKDWKILVDKKLTDKDKVIVGGGKQISKILLPVSTLINLPNVEVIENLSKPALVIL